MNRDTIERLAMDSAAGELNEDVEALFRAYISEHPRANQWAEDMLGIYEKTEAAINTKTKTPYAGVEGAEVKIKHLSQVKWRPVARWAAAVILGTVIGFSAGRWKITDETYRIASPGSGRGLRQVKTVSDLKEKYAGTFWGDKVLALLEYRPGQQYKADLHDIRFWDRYKQYIKEKRYE
ncbi:MAG: hypothetical protein ACYTFW_16180 [Planctomycetota bacterium]|jgi:hypothetical protein